MRARPLLSGYDQAGPANATRGTPARGRARVLRSRARQARSSPRAERELPRRPVATGGAGRVECAPAAGVAAPACGAPGRAASGNPGMTDRTSTTGPGPSERDGGVIARLLRAWSTEAMAARPGSALIVADLRELAVVARLPRRQGVWSSSIASGELACEEARVAVEADPGSTTKADWQAHLHVAAIGSSRAPGTVDSARPCAHRRARRFPS